MPVRRGEGPTTRLGPNRQAGDCVHWRLTELTQSDKVGPLSNLGMV